MRRTRNPDARPARSSRNRPRQTTRIASADGALAAHDQPVTVVPDPIHPARPEGRIGGEGGNTGLCKCFGTGSTRRHAGAIPVSSDQPQPSYCHGEAGVALSEAAKNNKIAALAALMTARGMFSRDHILPSPPIEYAYKEDALHRFLFDSSGKIFFWNIWSEAVFFVVVLAAAPSPQFPLRPALSKAPASELGLFFWRAQLPMRTERTRRGPRQALVIGGRSRYNAADPRRPVVAPWDAPARGAAQPAGTHPELTRLATGGIAFRRVGLISRRATCSCWASSALNAATLRSASASAAAAPRTCEISS
jgi:hypothetical protein